MRFGIALPHYYFSLRVSRESRFERSDELS
jgi:hypothetical protein